MFLLQNILYGILLAGIITLGFLAMWYVLIPLLIVMAVFFLISFVFSKDKFSFRVTPEIRIKKETQKNIIDVDYTEVK